MSNSQEAHSTNNTNLAKRQNSAPKIRHGKRVGNHQIYVQSQPKQKKRQTNSVSRATARAKSCYQQQLGSGYEKRPESGRPPIVNQIGPLSTQMRGGRQRNKNSSRHTQSQPNYPMSAKNISSTQLEAMSGKPGWACREMEVSPIKSLAAAALRQNQCQTAMQRHNKAKELASAACATKTPAGKLHKDIAKGNKTTSTRHVSKNIVEANTCDFSSRNETPSSRGTK